MIYITGDLHGETECRRLNTDNCKAKEGDYVIICGDFGLIFNNNTSETELYWLKWLVSKPWTTLFIDGNHDNLPKINQYGMKEFNGCDVHIIRHNILHIPRGSIFTLENKKFFCFGGAESTDKQHRTIGINYWQEEIPNIKEYNFAINNLKQHNNTVDYIISHTGPKRLIAYYESLPLSDPWHKYRYNDPTGVMLENIYEMVYFKEWYCGHFHTELTYESYKGNINIIYQEIKKLT